MVSVQSTIGHLPPLLGHVDLGARDRLVPWAARKPSEAEEVTGITYVMDAYKDEAEAIINS